MRNVKRIDIVGGGNSFVEWGRIDKIDITEKQIFYQCKDSLCSCIRKKKLYILMQYFSHMTYT